MVGWRRRRLGRLGRLSRGTRDGDQIQNPVRQETFSLDALGNWRTYLVREGSGGGIGTTRYHTRDHNLANEIADADGDSDAIETITGPDWADPAYDAAGNTTTVPRPSDPTAAYTCIYDAWNRLAEVRAGGATVARYRYDGPMIITTTPTGGSLRCGKTRPRIPTSSSCGAGGISIRPSAGGSTRTRTARTWSSTITQTTPTST